LTYTFRATDIDPPMLRHLRRQCTNHDLIVCAVALNNAQEKLDGPYFNQAIFFELLLGLRSQTDSDILLFPGHDSSTVYVLHVSYGPISNGLSLLRNFAYK
jgi:hypothetical protein